MPRKKGYKASSRLRGRENRGGNQADDLPQGEAGTLAGEVPGYLRNLSVLNYSENTIEGRRDALKVFLLWCEERSITDPKAITKLMLESYQRHLWRWRKKNGKPLGVSTQRGRIGTVKDYFTWLMRQNHIPANPASELQMPRQEKRLPEQAMSLNEVQRVLNVPDVTDPLGIRDRAMLELFYSSAIRRSELAKLEVTDLNHDRQVFQIHKGKGNKDRVVPVGKNALHWIMRYLDEARPLLLINAHERTLFLTSYGEAFNPDVISRMASQAIKDAGIQRGGSCHAIRHACATHMLEGGADIRFIQQLLGHVKLETTAIYTQVSIEQLKAVHAKTHPAESTSAAKKPPSPDSDQDA